MAFKVPRAERKVGDASQVIQGRAVAQTAGFEAEAALGQAIVRTGAALATVGNRIQTAKDRMAREEALNRSVNAANEVQGDLIQLVAKERKTPGLDSVGGQDRFLEGLETSFQARTADMSDDLKALTRQQLQSYSLKTRTGLASHEQEQRRGVTFSNLDQATDAAVQEAANNPTLDTMESQLTSVASTISLYRQNGSIDEEEAQTRVADAQQKIIVSAINSATLTDPEAAQALVDATKAVLPADIVKSLETDIRKQTKLQKDEADAERDATAQTFLSDLTDLAVDGAATITQAQASPAWEILTSKEKETARSVISKGSPFNASDPVTLAEVTTLVNTDPETITIDDFNEFHGRKNQGISTADYNRLVKQWQTKIEEMEQGTAKDPLQDGFEKQAYRLLEFMRKDTAFIEPGGFLIGQSPEELAENDLLAAQQVNSLARYIEDHPGEDYVETYIKPVLKPVQQGFISSIYDRVTSDVPSIIPEPDVDIRRQASDLLTKSGVDITREKINQASAQIQAGNTELKILDAETAQKLFDTASGTGEEKAENARRNALRQGFIIP